MNNFFFVQIAKFNETDDQTKYSISVLVDQVQINFTIYFLSDSSKKEDRFVTEMKVLFACKTV